MKKTILLTLLLLFLAVPGYSQKRKGNRGEMRKEVTEYKMKFLAQEMELKADQQKKFFDLYSDMDREMHELFSAARKAERKVKNCSDCPAEDYEKASEAISNAKVKAGEIEKRYDAKFSEFLNAKQIFKLHQAEQQFREKMRDMHAKRKGEKRQAKK